MPRTKKRNISSNHRPQVRGFGPSARANANFRPLTIRIAPSNTGKSCLAMLSYVIHPCFAGSPSKGGIIGRPRWLQAPVGEALAATAA